MPHHRQVSALFHLHKERQEQATTRGDSSMEKFVKKFWTEEDGNTTIDWMVLTAGLVLLGAAVMASVGTNSQALADDTTDMIEIIEPSTGV